MVQAALFQLCLALLLLLFQPITNIHVCMYKYALSETRHDDDDDGGGGFLNACISDPQRGTLTRERSQIHRIGSEDRPRDFRLFGLLANDMMIV